MKQVTALILMIAVLLGCGKQIDQSGKDQSLSSAGAMLDGKKYEAAIVVLENLHNENPADEEVSAKLLHAYAGAGGFEALKAVNTWKEIEQILKDVNKKQKKKLENSITKSADHILDDFEKILKPVPDLSENQTKRLGQAIKLYGELGMTFETAGKYNNFKWGILHTYRLAITVKKIIRTIKFQASKGKDVDVKEIESLVVSNLESMGHDIFMSYKLYSHSFDKIRKITESIDKVLSKTLKNETFKLKINKLAKTESEFLKSLVRDNLKAASALVSMAGDIYKVNGTRENVNKLINNLPTEQDLRVKQQRIESLVMVFLKQFDEKHGEVENKLKSIFTEQLKVEVIESAKLSLISKSTDPLKELLNSKRPEVEVLKGYYLILRGDLQITDIDESLRVEVNDLKKKVDLEMYKSELEKILLALKKDSKVLETGGRAVLHGDKDQLEARKILVKKAISQLENDLENVEESKETLESEDGTEDSQKEIIEDAKQLVESEL